MKPTWRKVEARGRYAPVSAMPEASHLDCFTERYIPHLLPPVYIRFSATETKIIINIETERGLFMIRLEGDGSHALMLSLTCTNSH